MASASPHHLVHHGTFGNDRFGILAERFARFFGTPRFIIMQTAIVALWIVANAAAFSFRWDPYPFILLNLVFSTQAAYAAPTDPSRADAPSRARQDARCRDPSASRR